MFYFIKRECPKVTMTEYIEKINTAYEFGKCVVEQDKYLSDNGLNTMTNNRMIYIKCTTDILVDKTSFIKPLHNYLERKEDQVFRKLYEIDPLEKSDRFFASHGKFFETENNITNETMYRVTNGIKRLYNTEVHNDYSVLSYEEPNKEIHVVTESSPSQHTEHHTIEENKITAHHTNNFQYNIACIDNAGNKINGMLALFSNWDHLNPTQRTKLVTMNLVTLLNNNYLNLVSNIFVSGKITVRDVVRVADFASNLPIYGAYNMFDDLLHKRIGNFVLDIASFINPSVSIIRTVLNLSHTVMGMFTKSYVTKIGDISFNCIEKVHIHHFHAEHECRYINEFLNIDIAVYNKHKSNAKNEVTIQVRNILSRQYFNITGSFFEGEGLRTKSRIDKIRTSILLNRVHHKWLNLKGMTPDEKRQLNDFWDNKKPTHKKLSIFERNKDKSIYTCGRNFVRDIGRFRIEKIYDDLIDIFSLRSLYYLFFENKNKSNVSKTRANEYLRNREKNIVDIETKYNDVDDGLDDMKKRQLMLYKRHHGIYSNASALWYLNYNQLKEDITVGYVSGLWVSMVQGSISYYIIYCDVEYNKFNKNRKEWKDGLKNRFLFAFSGVYVEHVLISHGVSSITLSSIFNNVSQNNMIVFVYPSLSTLISLGLYFGTIRNNSETKAVIVRTVFVLGVNFFVKKMLPIIMESSKFAAFIKGCGLSVSSVKYILTALFISAPTIFVAIGSSVFIGLLIRYITHLISNKKDKKIANYRDKVIMGYRNKERVNYKSKKVMGYRNKKKTGYQVKTKGTTRSYRK